MSRLGKLFYSHRIGSQNEHWRFLCLIVEKDLFHREISLVRFLGMPIFKYMPQRDILTYVFAVYELEKIPSNSSSTVCVYGNRWNCCRAFRLEYETNFRFFCRQNGFFMKKSTS